MLFYMYIFNDYLINPQIEFSPKVISFLSILHLRLQSLVKKRFQSEKIV